MAAFKDGRPLMKIKDAVRGRVERLKKALADDGFDAFVIVNDEGSNWESLYYMSGFRGTSGVLAVFRDSAELVLDSRYISQGREQSPLHVLSSRSGIAEDVRDMLSTRGASKVLCEAGKTSHAMWEKMSAGNTLLSDGTEYICGMRRTKDEVEAECIKEAARIAALAFTQALEHVRPGMTEKEFEALLNYNIALSGGETGFDMIVASGVRGAMPHARASDKTIRAGECVTVDFGVRFNGYFCDITRNFCVGSPDGMASDIHEILKNAHRRAAGMLCEGASGTGIHNAALNVLEEASLGQYFTHGLGHGFGLEIHEPPFLSSRRDDILKAGDVVTVEPGVYIDGWGGLRLEDDYLVTESGAERLTGNLDQSFFCR